MYLLLTESLVIGFITWILSTIIFNLSINKFNKNQPLEIDLAFFITGAVLYIIFNLPCNIK